MNPRLNIIYYCGITLLILSAIAWRMNADMGRMNNAHIRSLIHAQKTYSTTLTIHDDPESAYFTSHTIASDETISRRVLVQGTTNTNGELSSVHVGDKVIARGYLSELTKFQTYKRYEHIVGVFHVESFGAITFSHSPINAVSQHFRDIVTRGCSRLGINERGVCEGLLIGERSHISQAQYNSYKKAQLTHLLVASGANIAFLVAFLNPFLSRLSRHNKNIILISVAVIYCIATRCEPSILRACIMVVVPSLASLRGYVLTQSRVFMTTIVACLLIDPFLVYRVGFWLSAAATAGLYFLSPVLSKKIKSTLVANTLAATICVQPVLWFAFGFQFPARWPASVIAIAIAEPLSTIGMVSTCFVSFLSPHALVAQPFILAFQYGCMALNGMAHLGSSVPGFWVGCAFSMVLALAYTRDVRRKFIASPGRKSHRVGQERVLHYR